MPACGARSLIENRKENMDSLWSKTVERPDFPQLSGDAACDVLIIGGGMAGVLLAKELHQRNVDYLLIEAKRIGSGTTQGTTAVLTAQHDTLYENLIRRFGEEKARQYLKANLDAVERFRALSADIPCDFEEKPSFMFSRMDDRALRREAQTVRRLGFPAQFVTKTRLPFPVAGAVIYPDMAAFHPLKFCYGIAQGLNIRENTFAQRIDRDLVVTDRGTIRAKKIVIAAHFPFINSRGLYFMKLYQMRSYIVALENAPDLGGTYVNMDENGMYFRNVGDLLLVGGGDRRTGRGCGFEQVRGFIRHVFPMAHEKFAWAAQDCMSLDGVPYIGLYSRATPELFVATGFNEWGMTSAMVASQLLADRIEGKQNPYAPVFSPQRSMLRAQLLVNLGVTLADFVIPTFKRCSHMGCALVWNETEHSYDCPCHGSRFDEHGHVIDNPAMKQSRVE